MGCLRCWWGRWIWVYFDAPKYGLGFVGFDYPLRVMGGWRVKAGSVVGMVGELPMRIVAPERIPASSARQIGCGRGVAS